MSLTHVTQVLPYLQKRVLNGSLLAEETLVEFSPNVSSLTQFQPLNGGNGDRWRSQLILSIAADIWLSVPTMSYREEMPKPLHLVVLRYAVKHLHKYVYTGPIPPEELHHRESLTQRLFSQPLLGLLSLSFKKWPLDSSFRYALELWLSFVQPWRYASADEGGEAENPKVIFHQWVKFLSGHLAFYTSLLASCCDRLARTDLTSSNSSFIAYRMIKVFALPGLVELLEQTERNCMAPSFTDLSFHMKYGEAMISHLTLLICTFVSVKSP